ncbi:homoserine kinase [Segnochrobactraceae bacterium EtOH-i3]
MAVYTEISDAELAAFVARYDIGAPRSVKGIAEGVENTNYMLETEGGRFILTLYEKRVDPADLPFFLGLMDHLSSRGVTCPTPIHDREGGALGVLAGRPAAMVSFLDGMWPRAPNAVHCGAVGQALARMHAAGQDFPLRRVNALSLPAWAPLYAGSAARADEVRPGLAATVTAELEALARDWPTDLPVGVIHADLFPDNVFFLGERLSGLIDFYFACTDMLAYDLAICLNAWCFEPDRSFNYTKGRAMIAGYQAERPLGTDEVAALPVLCRGAAMRFLLTRLHDWLNVPPGALVTPKDPGEYLDKLRFHQKVAGAGAYGLES